MKPAEIGLQHYRDLLKEKELIEKELIDCDKVPENSFLHNWLYSERRRVKGMLGKYDAAFAGNE